MRTSDFDYHLPEDLVAQEPGPRGASRMLVLDRATGIVDHRAVRDLPELLRAGDLLVLNDTRVMAARVEARRHTGRRFELLMLEPEPGGQRWQALVRPSARVRAGEPLALPDGGEAVPLEALGEGRWTLELRPALDPERLDRIGSVPLPPYIRRDPTERDRERYQTVYAARPGAVAAPTAGLHFTPGVLDALRGRGVQTARLTLHVGIGTFRPVSAELVRDHVMHAERYEIPPETAAAVAAAHREGRRVVAVGTTSVRALEGSAAASGGLVRPGWASTDLFITPGYGFRVVGALLTNFHLPRSTLLMLVSAFAGREPVLAAYRAAVERRYRFFSYGDAMLIL